MMSVSYAAEVLLVFFWGPKKSEQPTRGNTKVFRTFYFRQRRIAGFYGSSWWTVWFLWLRFPSELTWPTQTENLGKSMEHQKYRRWAMGGDMWSFPGIDRKILRNQPSLYSIVAFPSAFFSWGAGNVSKKSGIIESLWDRFSIPTI